MKHYTDTIPLALAEKLKDKGMPITYYPLFAPVCEGADQSVGLIRPSYAEVFDWMLERDIIISIEVDDCKKDGKWTYDYGYYIGRIIPPNKLVQTDFVQLLDTWHEAANAAIEKALTLIYESMTEKLHDILERIYNQGCYAGESSHFDDWLYEEGCDRADYITNTIREAVGYQWHKASEELPKKGGMYLIWIAEYNHPVTMLWGDYGWDDPLQDAVEYWMEIPELPKED